MMYNRFVLAALYTFLTALVFSFSPTLSSTAHAQPVENPEVQQELLRMLDAYLRLLREANGTDSIRVVPPDTFTEEQAARTVFATSELGDTKSIAWYEWDTLASELRTRYDSLGRAQGQQLMEIVQENGFPDKQMVGMFGASAAFLLWKHSVDADTQKRLLPLVLAIGISYSIPDSLLEDRQLALRAQLNNLHKAKLTDRVHLRQTRTQIYGTHLCRDADSLQFFPIADRAEAKARRQEMGLTPLDEFLNGVNSYCPCPDHEPCPDWAKGPDHSFQPARKKDS